MVNLIEVNCGGRIWGAERKALAGAFCFRSTDRRQRHKQGPATWAEAALSRRGYHTGGAQRERAIGREHDGQFVLGVTQPAAREQQTRAGPFHRAGTIKMTRGRAVLLRQRLEPRHDNGGRRRHGGR
jgi:hypothetical protein